MGVSCVFLCVVSLGVSCPDACVRCVSEGRVTGRPASWRSSSRGGCPRVDRDDDRDDETPEEDDDDDDDDDDVDAGTSSRDERTTRAEDEDEDEERNSTVGSSCPGTNVDVRRGRGDADEDEDGMTRGMDIASALAGHDGTWHLRANRVERGRLRRRTRWCSRPVCPFARSRTWTARWFGTRERRARGGDVGDGRRVVGIARRRRRG